MGIALVAADDLLENLPLIDGLARLPQLLRPAGGADPGVGVKVKLHLGIRESHGALVSALGEQPRVFGPDPPLGIDENTPHFGDDGHVAHARRHVRVAQAVREVA